MESEQRRDMITVRAEDGTGRSAHITDADGREIPGIAALEIVCDDPGEPFRAWVEFIWVRPELQAYVARENREELEQLRDWITGVLTTWDAIDQGLQDAE